MFISLLEDSSGVKGLVPESVKFSSVVVLKGRLLLFGKLVVIADEDMKLPLFFI